MSRLRPIPSSWRKLDTGSKTRYDLYYSLLSDEDKAKEDEIEAIYQEKLREWNRATSHSSTENQKYIKEYAIGVFDD